MEHPFIPRLRISNMHILIFRLYNYDFSLFLIILYTRLFYFSNKALQSSIILCKTFLITLRLVWIAFLLQPKIPAAFFTVISPKYKSHTSPAACPGRFWMALFNLKRYSFPKTTSPAVCTSQSSPYDAGTQYVLRYPSCSAAQPDITPHS